MLRIVQNSSAIGAKSYYSTADYYTEGQELVGVWRGQGAERLGLSGVVNKSDWDSLCDNLNPATGKSLTVRQKEPRRIGYDFNFHVPKSVSLAFGLTRDERIVDAFRDAVESTMADIESEAQTRVRVSGKNEDRTTVNLVWGEFIHFTSRPVDGIPDPHLHAHCFVFNTTWDDVESRWKAGQFAGLKRDGPYFEAAFHARLAWNLEHLGFEVERNAKGWELAGVSRGTLRKFSRRTELIEAKAKAQGIVDPEAKGALGAKTRASKRKDLSLDELQDEWRSRLSDEERETVLRVATPTAPREIPYVEREAKSAVDHAIQHCFERESVIPERTLLAAALKKSIGCATPESVARELASRPLLSALRNGQRLVTTPEVLDEERALVAFARDGRGSVPAFSQSAHSFKRAWLNTDQRHAVEHVLGSRDRVIVVRGAAGVGKTSMMHEAVEGIEAAGKSVVVLAPSSDASRFTLREVEGFASADTVAQFLRDQRMQESARGQVIWVDEAGQLGARSMAKLFKIAERVDARIVLSGDRRQHGSVERGSALRLLEQEAGVKPAELRDIQRQSGDYKDAVMALSQGKVEKGLKTLDALGWIREATDQDRFEMIAKDYVEALKEKKSVLAVAPTHREGEWMTDAIRTELKRDGRLKKREHTLLSLTPTNLTEAERVDAVNYLPGDVLVFHQNAKGIKAGSRVVTGSSPLPLSVANRFQVYRPGTIRLAKGDLVRITRNGATADGKHKLHNGTTYTVKGFSRRGDLLLTNGWKLDRDFGHLAYGYVSTSHASQGKTVDRVLIGQSTWSERAASREQIYVSVSRGRERATIYTDNKSALFEAVERSSEKHTATEIVGTERSRARVLDFQRIERLKPERTVNREVEREREVG